MKTNDFIPNGYIVLARKIRRSSLWLSLKATHRVVMIELLLQAAWQDCEVVRSGEILKLERGQIATSYQDLVDDIGDKDITVKVVRNAIEKLVRHDFLTKDEAKARAKKGLLLTIVNYGVYQDTENYKGKAEGKDKGKGRAKQGQSKGKEGALNNNLNKSNKSKNDLKDKYAEFVTLSREEYDKLVSSHGEEKTKRMIDILDNYKGANNKKYASDYRAILNWVVKRVEEEVQREHKRTEPFSRGQTTAGQYNANGGSNYSSSNGKPVTDPRNASEVGGRPQANGSDKAPSKYNEFVRR